MSRFATLLRREWMQHHRGWLVLLGVPLMLALLAVVVPGSIEVDGAPPPPLALACMVTVVGALSMFSLAWMVMLLQAPGLARRDVQDRSVEFWMSLPVAPSASIAATLTLHALLMPMLALLVGFVLSQPVVAVLVSHVGGGYGALPWAQLLPAGLAVLARGLVGAALFAVWMSPLVLLPMAASAWLKRWGVPAVVAVVGGGSLVLDKVYGKSWGIDALRAVGQRAGRALVDTGGSALANDHTNFDRVIRELPAWALQDTPKALLQLADPVLLPVLAVSGLCFWALVQRRKLAA